MSYDVEIHIEPRDGQKRPMRIVFTETGLAKLRDHSPELLEGFRTIEGELAKILFPEQAALPLTEIRFIADDPDLADCEAQDIADLLLSRARLTATIYGGDSLAA